jgi:PhoPQ-activated pathogenicity-related protein
MVVLEAFSKEQYQVKNLGQLMSQGDRAFAETGDARETGYYALARIFSAAATLAAALPEVQGRRFVATGSSKGGMAAMIVLAGDPRFVGAYPTAFNAGDIKESTRLKGERWGWDVKPKETGPAGESARDVWRRFGDRRFQEFLDLFEVDRMGDYLKGKFVMPAVGTNDHLSHVLSDQSYIENLKAEWAFLRVPNYGHGWRTADHALGWRHTVASAFFGQRTPGVRLTQETTGERVLIHLAVKNTAREAIKELQLYSTTDPVGDYRNAKWESTSIATPSRLPAGERILVAETSIPKKGTTAYFARAIFQGEFCEAINCSNVVELGAPVIQKLEPRP